MEHRGSKRGRWLCCRSDPARIVILYLLAAILFTMSACDVFSPRTPEEPAVGSGTFLQPETPETVVDNLEAAVAELNPENYARSLADDLTFVPAAAAEGAYPWETWGKQDEVSYFRALAGVPQPGATHSLVLRNATTEFDGTARAVYDADYELIVHHRRLSEVADTLRGHLVWSIERDEDDLWRLQHWTDRSTGSTPSWSTLKAVFAQ